MCRGPLIAIVAVLALGGGATSAAADGPTGADAGTEVGVEFKLRAGGFVVELENNADDDDDELTLTVRGHRQAVVYLVEGEVTRKGVEAKFGKLGELSVGFQPTKTFTGRLPTRCEGEAPKGMEGVFSGTFRFRGERGYVESEATRVHGEMHVVPPRKCAPRRAALRSRPRAGRASGGEDTAVVSALRDHKVGFAAIAHRDPRVPSSTSFLATTFEPREGMRIYRYAYAGARAPAFRFNLRKGTAVVRPPWPFQGGARFHRGPHGHNSWAGSLRVQLLGIDPVDLAAPGFRARITNEYNDE
jgi:hypothetical protein